MSFPHKYYERFVLALIIVVGSGFALGFHDHAAEIMVAAGTLALAAATYFLVEESRAEAQQNRDEARENRQAQVRPLLIPQGRGMTADIWEQPFGTVNPTLTIRNVGHGVATNIWGVLLRPEEPRTDVPRQFYLRATLPLASNAERQFEFRDGGTMFTAEDTQNGFLLSPPGPGWGAPLANQWERHDRFIHRLTLTYHDIQGNKHASVFDLTGSGVWVTTGISHNISVDLGDLDTGKGTKERNEAPRSESYF